MKSVVYIALFSLTTLAATAQIPNGQFEEWQTIDTIENPVAWTTNNFYVGYAPVQKVEDAIEGNYSLKISSTARDLNGFATWPGCAHVKFLPTQTYQYMTASVRIDSVKEGRIEIRVKQRNANGFYEKIGGWVRNTVTVGVKVIWFPLEQMQLDTLLVEVWAFNKDTPEWETNTTYSSGILDNFALTNTVGSQEIQPKEAIAMLISPNPAREWLTVQLEKAQTGGTSLRLLDLEGRVRQVQEAQNHTEVIFDVSGLSPGIYVLELSRKGEIVAREKVVVAGN